MKPLPLLCALTLLALVEFAQAQPQPALHQLSCSAQADSFGLAVIAKGFLEDGIIQPPRPGGYFSYDAMGLVRNFLYKAEVGELVRVIRITCRQKGQAWLTQLDAALGLTYSFRVQTWESYQRTPYEYRMKYWQSPPDFQFHGFRLKPEIQLPSEFQHLQ